MSISRLCAARRRRGRGFTLLELLVVLAILALLIAFVGPRVLDYLSGARSDAAKIQMRNIEASIDLYRLDVGQYPPNLSALVEQPTGIEKWNGPYLKKATGIQDPWGKQYGYRQPGQHGDYDLFSLGRDKAEGGDEEDRDIVNW